MGVNRDRLFKQPKGVQNPLLRCGKEGVERAQVEIVGSEIGHQARGGSAHLGGLQCWLNHAGNT